MKKYSKTKGFTLIELLLAMSLLMIIMYTGYYSYSLYSDGWEKRSQLFWQDTKNLLAFDAIDRAMSSVTPYIVMSDKDQPAIYFNGNSSRLIFITGSPLFSKQSAVVELEFEQTKNELYQLVYRETSLSNILVLAQSDEIYWQRQAILFDNIVQGSFRYFGWRGFQQILENNAIAEQNIDASRVELIPAEWYNSHLLEIRRVLPIKVRINLLAEDKNLTQIDLALPENAYMNLLHYLREDA